MSIFDNFSAQNISWWIISDIYSSFSRFTVPIMIMISGALLLDPEKESSIKIFYNKRLNKVFVPFIFWAILYIMWKDMFEGKLFSPLSAFNDLITGNVYFHLWFLYIILGLYLITPLLKIYIKKASGTIKYFLILWFIFPGINFFIGYIGYYLLGHYLDKLQINKKYSPLLYLTFLLGLLTTIIGSYLTSIGNYTINFQHPFAPNIILMAASFFLIIKNINWKSNKIITEIASTSFGIYLIHIIILDLLKLNGIEAASFNPILSIPILTLTILMISYITIKIMNKSPVFKKMVP